METKILKEQQKCDILVRLVDSGCMHLVEKVLLYLDSWQLQVSSHVSCSWRKIILTSFFHTNYILRRIESAEKLGKSTGLNTCLTFHNTTKVFASDVVSYQDKTQKKTNFYKMWILVKCKEKIRLQEWILFGGFHLVNQTEIKLGETESCDISCADFKDDILALCLESSNNYQVFQIIRDNHQDKTNLCRQVSVISTHSKPITKISISYGRIFSCSQDCSVTVVTIGNKGVLQVTQILQGHVSRIRCIAVHSHLIITGSDDRTAKLWDLKSEDGSKAKANLSPHRWGVESVEINKDWCITTDSKQITIWNHSGSMVNRINMGSSAVNLHLGVEYLTILDLAGSINRYHFRNLLENKNICAEDTEDRNHLAWSVQTKSGEEMTRRGALSSGLSTFVSLSFIKSHSKIYITLLDFL